MSRLEKRDRAIAAVGRNEKDALALRDLWSSKVESISVRYLGTHRDGHRVSAGGALRLRGSTCGMRLETAAATPTAHATTANRLEDVIEDEAIAGEVDFATVQKV